MWEAEPPAPAKAEMITQRTIQSPVEARDQIRLSLAEIRVLRLACEFCRDSAQMKDTGTGLDPEMWSEVFSGYRNAVIGLWAAGRNGGWVEERHAANLYYGGLMYLARDLTRLPYFTIGDAQTLHNATKRLGSIVRSQSNN